MVKGIDAEDTAQQIARRLRRCGSWDDEWKAWTDRATRAIGRAFDGNGLAMVVHKGRPHEGRSEYLGLDVMGSRAEWGKPTMIAELENRTHPDWPAYALWKLLSVDAEARFLLAFFNGNARTRPASAEELAKLLADQVAQHFPGRRAYLLLADSAADKCKPLIFEVLGPDVRRVDARVA